MLDHWTQGQEAVEWAGFAGTRDETSCVEEGEEAWPPNEGTRQMLSLQEASSYQ